MADDSTPVEDHDKQIERAIEAYVEAVFDDKAESELNLKLSTLKQLLYDYPSTQKGGNAAVGPGFFNLKSMGQLAEHCKTVMATTKAAGAAYAAVNMYLNELLSLDGLANFLNGVPDNEKPDVTKQFAAAVSAADAAHPSSAKSNATKFLLIALASNATTTTGGMLPLSDGFNGTLALSLGQGSNASRLPLQTAMDFSRVERYSKAEFLEDSYQNMRNAAYDMVNSSSIFSENLKKFGDDGFTVYLENTSTSLPLLPSAIPSALPSAPDNQTLILNYNPHNQHNEASALVLAPLDSHTPHTPASGSVVLYKGYASELSDDKASSPRIFDSIFSKSGSSTDGSPKLVAGGAIGVGGVMFLYVMRKLLERKDTNRLNVYVRVEQVVNIVNHFITMDLDNMMDRRKQIMESVTTADNESLEYKRQVFNAAVVANDVSVPGLPVLTRITERELAVQKAWLERSHRAVLWAGNTRPAAAVA